MRSYLPSDSGGNLSSRSDGELLQLAWSTVGMEAPTPTSLHEVLRTVDPITFERLHQSDARRIRRSLEIFVSCGRPQSQLLDEHSLQARYRALGIWVRTSLPQLDARLDQRCDAMIAAGGLQEIALLRQKFRSAALPLDWTRGVLQAIGTLASGTS